MILILWGLDALIGCAPFKYRVPDATVARERLVLLQVLVVALQTDNGKDALNKEWGSVIAEKVRPLVKRLVVHRGGTVASSEKLEECEEDEDCEDVLTQLRRWSARSSMEILSGKGAPPNNKRNSVGDWRFKDDLSTLRDTINSDQVLTVLFRTHRQKTGTMVMGLVGGLLAALTERWIVDTQDAVACITDLKDGRMIWCNTAVGRWDDPADKQTAQWGIEELVNEIYGPFAPRPPTPSDERPP